MSDKDLITGATEEELDDLLSSFPKESLYHFGVPGMKWGVRRKRGGKLKSTPKAAKPKETDDVSDHEKAIALKRKGVKNLSTKELKELNNRLQLEKSYRELNPSKIAKGMKLVNNYSKNLEDIVKIANSPAAKYVYKKSKKIAKRAPKTP